MVPLIGYCSKYSSCPPSVNFFVQNSDLHFQSRISGFVLSISFTIFYTGRNLGIGSISCVNMSFGPNTAFDPSHIWIAKELLCGGFASALGIFIGYTTLQCFTYYVLLVL